jgi:hypothetical protein
MAPDARSSGAYPLVLWTLSLAPIARGIVLLIDDESTLASVRLRDRSDRRSRRSPWTEAVAQTVRVVAGHNAALAGGRFAAQHPPGSVVIDLPISTSIGGCDNGIARRRLCATASVRCGRPDVTTETLAIPRERKPLRRRLGRSRAARLGTRQGRAAELDRRGGHTRRRQLIEARERSRKSRTGRRGSDAEPTVTVLLPESERGFPLLWSAEP